MKKFLFLLIFAASISNLHALPEKKKIQLLLDKVEKSGLTFIRNGSKHTSAAARKHLEMKMNKSWVTINTAEKFIKYIATKSSFSGNLYMIQLKNGTKIKSADWLKARLREIESHAKEN